MSRRPRVRVNQLGYLLGRPKQATLISDAEDPVPFTVRDRDGVAVYTGLSQPWSVRPEPTSGLNVHVLDFSGLNMQGAGFRIESADQCSHPFEVTSRVYDRLRADALRFFYVMRSGTPILDEVAPGYGRPAGHAGRPPNRGDLAVPAWTGAEARRLYPGWRWTGTFDVQVAGMTRATTASTSQAAASRCGSSSAPSTCSRRADSSPLGRKFADLIRSECRWQLDWLMRMQVPAGDPLSGLAFHRVHGTQWSPMPGWAHEDPTERVLHRPSTAATLHLAAVAAKGARLFRATEPAYAGTLLEAARTAYDAARRHPHLDRTGRPRPVRRRSVRRRRAGGRLLLGGCRTLARHG